ncbi:MAG: HEAT repeat domain-containing protein [Gammaproteobacteria bacterium]|nr:HEAT repeat domain-containing protein [Gammaproteobacteria bacterium]
MAEKKEIIEALRGLLTKGDDADRSYACRALGVMGSSDVTPDLVARLQDEDIDVCIDAVDALGKLGDKTCVEPLLESLRNDPNSDIKTSIVEALGRLGGEDVIPFLLQIVKSEPEGIVWEDDDSWNPWWDMQLKAVEALRDLGEQQAVPILKDILDNEDEYQDIDNEIMKAMAVIGGPGEAELIQRLSEGSNRARRRSVLALAVASSTASSRALGRALQDVDDEVRAAAIQSLANRGCHQYLRAILLLLKDPVSTVREAAITAIPKLSTGTDEDFDLESLLPLLDDQDSGIRSAVLNVLEGLLPDERVEEIQEQVRLRLEDHAPEVVSAACRLAGRMHDVDTQERLLAILADTEKDKIVRREAALALGNRAEIYPAVLDGLTGVLNDKEQALQSASLHALLELDNHGHWKETDQQVEDSEQQTVPPLELIITALRGERFTTEETASGETESEDSSAEKEGATDDVIAKESTNTDETEEELQKVPQPVISTLDAILMENEEQIKQAQQDDFMADPLQDPQLDEEETENVQEFMDILKRNQVLAKDRANQRAPGPGVGVRSLSARILGNSAKPEAVTALLEALNDENPTVQNNAVDALTRIARNHPETPGLTDAIEPLTTLIHVGDINQRVACACALGAIAHPASVPHLLNSLKDDYLLLRTVSIKALGDILLKHPEVNIDGDKDKPSTKDVIRKLKGCLKDKDPSVCKAAARALSNVSRHDTSDELRIELVKQFVQTGFANSGSLARDMGHTLRELDLALAGNALLQELDNLPDSMQRRYAIEMLEELYRPADAA